ncbi:MAG: hypothetical protein ACRC7O_04835 [Fimbriiglobus sp.]
MPDSSDSTGWFSQASLTRTRLDAVLGSAPLPAVTTPPPAARFVFSSTGERHRIRFTAPGGGALDGLSAHDLLQLREVLDSYLEAIPEDAP